MGNNNARSSTATSSSSSRPEPGKVPRQNLDRKYSKKYSFIADQYQTLEQVQKALRDAGLESSNLILGIDFTKSNEWTGKHSFQGQSLHAINDSPNPYERAIKIIAQTLSVFDDDNLIPCFGFGDATTHDQYVFSFFPDNHPCNGLDHALARYRQIVPNLRLAGPTSFAPIVDAAVKVVEETDGQYHVLVIIADGQVTRSVDTDFGHLSPQEQATIDSIVAASDYPLSIILVGVGDGPWDMMRQFDDNIPARAFDNFQFVNFSEIMQKTRSEDQLEARFALAALMEIPAQYKATMELKLLGTSRPQPAGRGRAKNPLPPPPAVLQADGYASQIPSYALGKSFAGGSEAGRVPEYPPLEKLYSNPPDLSYSPYATHTSYLPTPYPPQNQQSPAKRSRDNTDNQQLCQVCMTEKKDLAFGCGHQTCRNCGKDLDTCPFCREKITTRIRLY